MRSRIVLLTACFVLAGLAMAYAAAIDGKWVAQVPGRGGQTRETTFTFKAEGEKLTGTVSGMQGDNPISDGVIKGNDVSFSQKLSFNGNDIKINYKGTLSGDELKLTRTREGGDQPGQEFVAKRVK
jgi:hypothetical protein